MAPIFFAFSFFAKNEEFAAIFHKKRKKILPIKIVKIGFALTNFFNFWLEKFLDKAFLHFLPNVCHFVNWNMLDTLWNYEEKPCLEIFPTKN